MILDIRSLSALGAVAFARDIFRGIARMSPEALADALLCQVMGLSLPRAEPGAPLWKSSVHSQSDMPTESVDG